jgi:hypothetical protein
MLRDSLRRCKNGEHSTARREGVNEAATQRNHSGDVGEGEESCYRGGSELAK